MRAADWLIDMGPRRRRARRPGRRRGHAERGRAHAGVGDRRVPVGPPAHRGARRGGRRRRRWLRVRGARAAQPARHRRRDPGRAASWRSPGVSGSGKSTLVNEVILRALQNRLHRAPVQAGRARRRSRGSRRSTRSSTSTSRRSAARRARTRPRTRACSTTSASSTRRRPTRKVRGYRPGRFSFNVKGGRCETCKGDGTIKIEMHFLPDVYVPCEVCKGRRYNRETLDVRFKGKSIADVLEMSVEEALTLLRQDPEAAAPPADAARRRARLRAARPAGHDALGRRGAAREARDRAAEGGDRADALRARRADDGPAPGRRREAAAGAAAAGRQRQHGARDRAQPRRDQAGRLGRRPRARGRRRGRRDHRGGHARGGRRGRGLAHRAASCAACWRSARSSRRRRSSEAPAAGAAPAPRPVGYPRTRCRAT